MNFGNQLPSSMHREQLGAFFEQSPTVRLLKADSAPLLIEFFYRTFKRGETIALGQADLRAKLILFQEDLHDTTPDQLTGNPDRYLNHWVEQQWLKRFLEANSSEPQYQLTRYAEEAMRFTESAANDGRQLVGTDSRLRMVIELLADIVRGSSSDPRERLTYLRSQVATIQEEIARLESGQTVEAYQPSQIRERFQNAVHLLKDLQSDFRAVEERFLAIARDVQHKQALGSDTRGQILGYALDAEELMKKEDEGISFYSFVALLFSPSQQETLAQTIASLQSLQALEDQQDSLNHVKRIIPSLLAEAEKVMRTNARLSTTLRRLLDSKASAERIRLTHVLRDIRQAALQLADKPIDKSLEISIDTEIDIQSPFARTLWSPQETFDVPVPTASLMDPEETRKLASAFAKLERLDLRKLRGNIKQQTLRSDSTTLASLLAAHPPQSGIVEILGYIQIAHDDHHSIDPQTTETIVLQTRGCNDRESIVTVPKITFRSRTATNVGVRKPK